MDSVARPGSLTDRAVSRFEAAANSLGASFERFYPSEVLAARAYDAVLIRADTDPRNLTYAVARLAEDAGRPVLDPADCIAICCNKIHMGRLLEQAGVPTPPTRYLLKDDVRRLDPAGLFEELGEVLVLKAPLSAFSAFVEKVDSVAAFERESKRFLRRVDGLVVQAFTPTTFDWRVGLVGDRVIYVARYHMPSGAWRVFDVARSSETDGPNGEAGQDGPATKGARAWGKVEGVPVGHAPRGLLKVAKQAARAIGPGLFGVDIKETPDGFLVIEVNDNPTIYEGYEDQCAPGLYEDIVSYLLEAEGPVR